MQNNDLTTLKQLIEKYPWYSLAHLELYKKVSKQGAEARSACLGQIAAYVHSRESLYEISELPVDEEFEVEFLESLSEYDSLTESNLGSESNENPIESFSHNDEIVILDTSQIVHSGDFFTRNQMESLELDSSIPIDKFIVEKPSLLRGAAPLQDQAPLSLEIPEGFEDSGFYTETLANIYAEQGFVKRAMDVYAKLILLYPEKSIYFASLVKELKTKHNI